MSAGRFTSGSTSSPTRARRCYAPLAGTVHAFADNPAALDYGRCIILRHTTDDGTEFFTLYGHLSRESLHGLARRRSRRSRGERFATLGAPDVNGGWTPHLHLQLFTDLLGLGTDVPGVARASQRAAWRSLCPDPNLLVGVPPSDFRPSRRQVRDAGDAAPPVRPQPEHRLSRSAQDRPRLAAISVRRRRTPLHRRVQQRPARRPRSPARRRRGRSDRWRCSTRTRAI